MGDGSMPPEHPSCRPIQRPIMHVMSNWGIGSPGLGSGGPWATQERLEIEFGMNANDDVAGTLAHLWGLRTSRPI